MRSSTDVNNTAKTTDDAEVGKISHSTPNVRENRAKRDRGELSPNDHTDTMPKRDRVESDMENSSTNRRSMRRAN